MKLIISILCLVLTSASFASDSSMLVGNAGEGVVYNGNVYLRDLFEFSLHKKPYIGEKLNPHILTALEYNQSLADLPVDLKLLARKLTDLNDLSPRLGMYVLEALQRHHWILFEPPLQKFPDDGSPVAGDRIPLANRLQLTVRLQEQPFLKLSEEHKVALIIHEGVSSFQDPDFDKGYSTIDERLLREAIAVMFSGWTRKADRINEYLDSYSNVPSYKIRKDYPLADLLAFENISFETFQTPPPNSYTQLNLIFCDPDPRAPHLAEIVKKHHEEGYPARRFH